jgi:hypothetical protein
MRKNYVIAVATLVFLSTTLIPTQSFGEPIATPGNSQGEGPCATSGNLNSQTQSVKNPLKTCYLIGGKGPGGGTIFYYSSVAFTVTGATCASSCHYLEWAPSNWWSNSTDGPANWAGNVSIQAQPIDNTTEDGTGNQALGAGFANTQAMINNAGQSMAPYLCNQYAGTDNSVGQWFLPSYTELRYMFTSSALPSGGFLGGLYWTSSEIDSTHAWAMAMTLYTNTAPKGYWYNFRPIRAF